MRQDRGLLTAEHDSTTVVVNEIFGPTVQGEGPSMGRNCAFIRLGGCNLSCRWCDTPYTWDWKGVSDTAIAFDPRKELHRMTARKIIAEVRSKGVDLLVVSGGEPLSQQHRIIPLIAELRSTGMSVEIETNGTIVPHDRLIGLGVRFNVSPKLAFAGDTIGRRIVPQALERLNGTAGVAFKFVCRTVSHLDEVAELQASHRLREIWITPEGRTVKDLDRHFPGLADEVTRRGWNLSHRLHMLAWGEKRGV
ncbi:7-carboxy-7-deazaguanine synthase QueE [Nonomuraea fuscirosea]|uniref:7-carboxy-7-deazaguanine synthase QueE n=1 Tax=Nonomuraea fuscirosea TaxID=1291556 RepID=UPI0034279EE7